MIAETMVKETITMQVLSPNKAFARDWAIVAAPRESIVAAWRAERFDPSFFERNPPSPGSRNNIPVMDSIVIATNDLCGSKILSNE